MIEPDKMRDKEEMDISPGHSEKSMGDRERTEEETSTGARKILWKERYIGGKYDAKLV